MNPVDRRFRAVRLALVITGVLSLLPPPAQAQADGPSLTIDQLSQRVVQGNRDIQAAALLREAARAATSAAQALGGPCSL